MWYTIFFRKDNSFICLHDSHRAIKKHLGPEKEDIVLKFPTGRFTGCIIGEAGKFFKNILFLTTNSTQFHNI